MKLIGMSSLVILLVTRSKNILSHCMKSVQFTSVSFWMYADRTITEGKEVTYSSNRWVNNRRVLNVVLQVQQNTDHQTKDILKTQRKAKSLKFVKGGQV